MKPPNKLYATKRPEQCGRNDRGMRRVYEYDPGPNGLPDVATEKLVCIVNPYQSLWTADHQRQLDAILMGLRAAATPV
jgi:hypothetical protein